MFIVKNSVCSLMNKNKIYALSLEEVELIAEHGHVLIVKNVNTGIKFSTLATNVTEIQNQATKEIEKEKSNIIPLSEFKFEKSDKPIVKTKSVSKNKSQTTLW